MPSNPETRLTKRITDHLAKLDEPIWWFKVHGSQYQQAGVPDLIVCYMGRFVGLEVKVGKNKASPIQMHIGKKIEDAMGSFAVVRSIEEVDAVLAVVSSECRPAV